MYDLGSERALRGGAELRRRGNLKAVRVALLQRHLSVSFIILY